MDVDYAERVEIHIQLAYMCVYSHVHKCEMRLPK